MLDFIKPLLVYFIAFALALYALNGLDFSRFMRKGRTMQIQTLYLLLAAVIAYLFGQFLLTLMRGYHG